jgi:ubiquinone biosynthesis protein UbiJ
MGLRDKLRRLERAAEGELVTIPQRDGSTITEESRRALESLSSGAFMEDLEPATSPVEDLSE